MGKHYIGPDRVPVGQFSKKCPSHGSDRVRSSGFSASFQKMPGWLGSRPHLVADRADVVPANMVDRLADRVNVVLTHTQDYDTLES